jgi:hypothetical protein
VITELALKRMFRKKASSKSDIHRMAEDESFRMEERVSYHESQRGGDAATAAVNVIPSAPMAVQSVVPIRDSHAPTGHKTIPVTIGIHSQRDAFVSTIRAPEGHTYTGVQMFKVNVMAIDGNLAIIARPLDTVVRVVPDSVYIEYNDLANGYMSIGSDGFIIKAKMVGSHFPDNRIDIICRVAFDSAKSIITIVEWGHNTGYQSHGKDENIPYYIIDRFGRESNEQGTIAISGEAVKRYRLDGIPIHVLAGADSPLPDKLTDHHPRSDYFELKGQLADNVDKLEKNELIPQDEEITFLTTINHADAVECAMDRYLSIIRCAKQMGATRGSPGVLRNLGATRNMQWYRIFAASPLHLVNCSSRPARTWSMVKILGELLGEDYNVGECPDVYEAHGGMDYIIAAIHDSVSKALSGLRSIASLTYDRFKKIISGLFCYGQNVFDSLGSQISQLFDGAISRVFNQFVESIMAFDSFLNPRLMHLCFVFFVITCSISLGFFTVKVIMEALLGEDCGCRAMVGVPSGLYTQDAVTGNAPRYSQEDIHCDCCRDFDYEAHGNDAIEGTAGIASLLLNKTISSLSGNGQAKHVKILKDYVAIFAAGAVGVKALKGIGEMLWLLLPINIKSYLTLRFGSSDARNRLIFDQWRDMAIVITRNQIPAIVTCSVYQDSLLECVQQFVKEEFQPPPEHRQFAYGLFMQLLNKLAVVERFNAGATTRQMPFSLHFYGKPGAGKSVTAKKIFKSVFGYESSEIYTRSQELEYWSGYVNQQAVFWDEFLAMNDETRQTEHAGQYLDLISSSDFTPPFADIAANPITGQKGTKVHPEVVVTANNISYNRPPKVSVDAFQRRRNNVVQIMVRSHLPCGTPVPFSEGNAAQGGNVDLVKVKEINPQYIEDLAHMQFRILPGMYSSIAKGGVESYPLLSYKELIDEIKISYERFKKEREIMTNISTSNRAQLAKVEPELLFYQAIARTKGIPVDECSILSEIATAGLTVINPTINARRGDNENGKQHQDVRHLAQSPIPDDTGYYSASSLGSPAADVERFKEVVEDASEQSRIAIIEKSEQVIPPEIMTATPSLMVYIDEYLNAIYEGMKGKFGGASSFLRNTFGFEEVGCTPKMMRIIACSGIALAATWLSVVCGLKMVQLIKSFLHKEEIMEYHSETRRKAERKTVVRNRINNSYHGHGIDESHPKSVLEFEFHYDMDNGSVRYVHGYGIPLYGKKFLTNLHHFYSTKNGTTGQTAWVKTPSEGTITIRGKSYPVVLREIKPSYDFNTDTIIIQVEGNTCPNFPDNRGKFIADDEVEITSSPQVGSITIPDKNVYHGTYVLMGPNDNVSYTVPWSAHSSSAVEATYVYRLNVPSKHGDCGSPLVGLYGRYAGKILGMLCAGQESKGASGCSLCTMVTKELVEELDTAAGEYQGHTDENEVADYCNRWNLDRIKTNPKYHNDLVKTIKRDSFENLVEKAKEGSQSAATTLAEIFFMTTGVTAWLAQSGLNETRASEIYSDLNLDKWDKLFTDELVEKISEFGCPQGTPSLVTAGKTLVETSSIIEACNEFRKKNMQIYHSHGSGKFEGPNIAQFDVLPYIERVHLNRKTAIQESVIRPYMPADLVSMKKPAILEPLERDGEVVDPIDVKIRTIGSVEFKHQLDSDILDQVSKDVEDHYKILVHNSDGIKRMLTLEESIGGIDGEIRGMCLSTSAGYPLCLTKTTRGKKDFAYYEGPQNRLVITDKFRAMTEQMESDILEGRPVLQNRWVAHLKDETVSQEKIDNMRTRTINCGDMVRQSIYRKYFGSLLSIINNNPLNGIPSCISLNQYSLDMDKIYEYLVGLEPMSRRHTLKFQAGDYSNFDINHHPEVTKKAYDIIRAINPFAIPDAMWEDFIQSESASPVAFGKYLVQFKSYHPSGCLFTTIKNNIQNEIYFRYVYKKLRSDRIFDEDIRMVVLGDDHILCMKEDVDFKGPDIQEGMKELGQTYTSDKKGAAIEDYQKWEDIHFLGAQPVALAEAGGRWVGAPKKGTIADMMAYTGDKDQTLVDKCEQALDLASLWSRDKYMELYKSLSTGISKICGIKLRNESWSSRRLKVARRVAGSDDAYYAFSEYDAHSGEAKRDLTTFHTTMQDSVVVPRQLLRERHGLGEEAMSMEFTLDSHIYRGSFQWTTDQAPGTIIGQGLAPFQLLSLGSQSNIQNMSFERFIYWQGDISLMLQVNGTPFLQGALALFWFPLGKCPTTYEREQWMALPHVVLNPHTASTVELTVPFQFPRSVLNTFAGIDQSQEVENLGSFVVGVLSPLVATASDAVTVTMYTSFPNSKLTIPRPTQPASLSLRGEIDNGSTPSTSRRETPSANRHASLDWVAHGQGGSTMTTNNTYNITDVAGNVPIENSTKPQGNTQNISPKADVSVVPMDNPIIASGAVPTVGQYPGMSRSNGLVPSQNLTLHPQRYERLHREIFDPKDMDIHNILARKAFFEEFQWEATDAVGTVLFSTNLNSVLGKNINDTIPFNVAYLNLCKFVRFDLTVELWAVKTNFQTGRVRATVAYGAPPPITATDVNVYYNQTLDFVDNEKAEFTIPYNQATEFIRAWEGADNTLTDPIQDYSLGTLTISVANQMRAAPSVSQTVNVLMMVSFTNVHMAIPNTVMPFDYTVWDGVSQVRNGNGILVTKATASSRKAKYDAHSGEVDAPITEEAQIDIGDQETPKTVLVTQDETIQKQSTPPCRLAVGDKFEYTVKTLPEILRRLHVIPGQTPGTGSPYFVVQDATTGTPITGGKYFIVVNTPTDVFRGFYAAWGGSLRYRFYDTQGVKDLFYVPAIDKRPAYNQMGVINNMMPAAIDMPPVSTQTSTYSSVDVTVTSDSNTTAFKATEFFFPTGQANYVDINVPFDTHFYYHVHQDTGEFYGLTGRSTGYVTVVTDSTSVYTAQAVGDDFAYGVFRPPPGLRLRGVTSGGVAGDGSVINFGGFMASL